MNANWAQEEERTSPSGAAALETAQRCYLMSWQNSSFDVHMLLKIFFCFQWIYCSSHPKVCLGLLCGCCIFNQDAIFYCLKLDLNS
ncbi:hypothetical protein Y1Q_0017246 [Alligator mississippiensis]|uniref:Uncharacterized protein n=1 Tax=Alligator mississippiensis TaxID=8496 RepID=A0A151NKX0_ALLMI|nr:hypothetical protein Y1Q_0017246 [Alligator mississippiensis]